MTRAELDAILGFEVSDEQWACISAPLEPFVIIAGAGTGKTAVMAARVLWLVASGLVADHQVLGLTFTNKAAAELAHRVGALLSAWRRERPADPGAAIGEPTIATYHAFAGRLLQEQGLRAGIEPGARLLSGAAVAQLAYRLVCAAEGIEGIAQAPATVAADLVALDANLAEQTIGTDELREHDRGIIAAVEALPRTTAPIRAIRDTARRRVQLADLVDRLRRERLDAGGLDFADQMRLCVELVTGSEELVATIRGDFPVVLLDEYQDTSIAQRVILSTLFAGTAVTAVGDPLQAIYGWRSASVANIEAFGAHFGADGTAPTRVLSVNRRSGEPILAAANLVAADLRAAHPQVASLRAPAPRPATVRAALLETIADEQQWVVGQIADQVAAGRSPADIAVLARTNDSLRPLQEALLARGIPAAISGTAALTSSPYAMAVLATLRILADPGDNTALVTLLAGPRWRIGTPDLRRLGSHAEQLAGGRVDAHEAVDLAERLRSAGTAPDPVERPSLLEAAADRSARVSARARSRLYEFLAELADLQGHVGEPLPELVARVAAATGARVEADLHAGRTGVGDVGLAGLLMLVERFADAEGRSGLGAFLAYLDAAELLGSEEEVDLPSVPGSVQLMTMHKAKGLEFPVVVLPHLSAQVFPGGKGSDRWTTRASVVPSELRDDRHVLPTLRGMATKDHDEYIGQCRAHDRSGDDRLAYVAITRARDVLIASGHWWGPTQKRMRGPSPYLQALRDQVLSRDPDVVEDPWVRQPADDEDGTAPANPLLSVEEEAAWPEPSSPDHPAARVAAAVADLRRRGSVGRPWEPSPDPSGGGAERERATGPGADPEPSPDPSGGAGPGTDPEPTPGPSPVIDPDLARQVAQWDAAIVALLARVETAGGGAPIRLPGVLSASATIELASDPDGFAERLRRPMPRRRNLWADLGTAFHAWVEQRLGVQPLLTDDELPGAADAGIETAEQLAELKETFERLPYASRVPAGLEVPFSLSIAGRIIRGRIDAVFPAGPEAPEGQQWEVVDWKTSVRDVADPLQLAIYRLAWAELAGVPLEAVGAAFAFVRSGTVDRPSDLADAATVAALLGQGPLPVAEAGGRLGTGAWDQARRAEARRG